MNYCLFNPLANNHAGNKAKDEVLKKIGEATEIDVTTKSREEMRAFLETLNKTEDKIYLVGGDGTLQKFANSMYGLDLPPVIFSVLCRSRTFSHDVAFEKPIDVEICIDIHELRLTLCSLAGKSAFFHYSV